MNSQLTFLLNQAIQYIQSGNLDSADRLVKQVIGSDKNNADAYHIHGVIHGLQNRHSDAIESLKKAVKLKPGDGVLQFNLAKAFMETKKFSESLPHFKKSTQLMSGNPDVWINFGKSLKELKRFNEALVAYERAIFLHQDDAEAWNNKGVTLNELKRFNEAIVSFDKALALNSDYAEAWYNKGFSYHDARSYGEAIVAYDVALTLRPNYSEAWNNKGIVLHDTGSHIEAIAHYDKALSLNPDYSEAWSNKGVTLSALKLFDEAIAHYDKALSLNPDIDWVSGYLLHAKMKICSWSDLENSLDKISKKLMTNENVANPFVLLALSDDAFLHKKCSEIYSREKYPVNSALGPIYKNKAAKKEKIRIAYFSPDFRNHPVSLLTAELFEIHDRGRFEVFAFSLQKAPNDDVNFRLRKGFDRFIDVENISDTEIAKLARKLEVDIAIDLAGLTGDSRTGIFSYRAAPIQVNWLGYPGTIGADFFDYIVADETIIPKSHQLLYAEKVVSLPNTYMVDDSKRIPSNRIFTREECLLPENVFIFCCFNNDYKFNPQVLDSWSRILLGAENSILWVSENNKYFKKNITAEFEMRGINPSRIIFAQRVELMSDHLSRFALADLFLDTHPYNAHTTAADSLKAGVPVLTFMGQSFASRVASSLLNAIGMPELITRTQKEYEELAIELANNPQKLMSIKHSLVRNRLTAPIFDTPLFAKHIESAYIKMYERWHADLLPDHITIV